MSFLKYAPKKFWLIALVSVLAGAAIVVVALLRRSETGRIEAPCGPIDWTRARMPAPVFLEASFSEEWLPRVLEGIAIVDPDGELHEMRGRLLLGEDPPPYSILIAAVNEEEHGKTEWSVDAQCRITRMKISIPVLVRDGRVRACVVAHEFGHALGLAHSEWEFDVMMTPQRPLFPCRMSEREEALLDRYR